MNPAPINIDIELIEINGKYWIRFSIDNQEMRREGPFFNMRTARSAIDRRAKDWFERAAKLPRTAAGTINVDAVLALRSKR